MKKIKLYDKIIPSVAMAMNNGRRCVKLPFEWYRGKEYTEISAFTDFSLDEVDNCDSKYKIAILMESPSIFPNAYNKMVSINNKFDLVFTFSKKLLNLGENYRRYYLSGTWIEEKDWGIYYKTKKVSMIASNKNTSMGHRLRHRIKERFGNQIDIYGTIENPIDNKIEGLKDYMYSIVIENCQHNYYFTEKLMDCFMTGTIPIFWGCNIRDVFNPSGYFPFKDLYILERFLSRCCELEYQSRGEGIVQNFYNGKRMLIAENMIWRTIWNEFFRSPADDNLWAKCPETYEESND